MLTYTFSRREKVLITIFTLLLITIGWYQLVYINTTEQIHMLNSKIESVELDVSTSKTKLAKKREMEKVIKQKKAEGAKTTPIPVYDNIKPLMAEMDTIMAKAASYTLQFESLDTEVGEYIQRGVTMHFTCGAYEQAEKMMLEIIEGPFPCYIDSVDIGTSKMTSAKLENADISVYIHVVFFERHPQSH